MCFILKTPFQLINNLYSAKVITQQCFILIISLFFSACIKPIISPKRKFNQSSILPHNGLNNLFPTVPETDHFMEAGWLKNEMHGDVPVSDMRHAFGIVKGELISEISLGILCIYKR